MAAIAMIAILIGRRHRQYYDHASRRRATLDAVADVSIADSTPAQVVNLSGISAGPADENSQTLTVMAISSNPALIANPTVTYNSPNAIGTVIEANTTLLSRYSAADVRQRPVLLR